MKNCKVMWKLSKDGKRLVFKARNRYGNVMWFNDKIKAERWAFKPLCC